MAAVQSKIRLPNLAVGIKQRSSVLIQAGAEDLQQAGELREHQRLVSFVEDFRDNDGIYGDEVGRFLVGTGIAEVKTAHRSPGKIHSWKGMEAPYDESCWIT